VIFTMLHLQQKRARNLVRRTQAMKKSERRSA
jgi:hypothetical protein